jgi:hypothetical protein
MSDRVRWDAAKYAQVKIQQRANEREIRLAEKEKPMDADKLSALYSRRRNLLKQEQDLIKARGKD